MLSVYDQRAPAFRLAKSSAALGSAALDWVEWRAIDKPSCFVASCATQCAGVAFLDMRSEVGVTMRRGRAPKQVSHTRTTPTHHNSRHAHTCMHMHKYTCADR